MEIQDHQISKECSAFGNSMSPSSIQEPMEVQKAKKPIELKKTVKLRNQDKNRSMDYNNLSIKAILMKYRSPFVALLFQKRPSCFPKRCSQLDSQRLIRTHV